MKKHLKIMGCYFRLNLASSLEYRSSFFVQAFGMALSNSSFIFFWWIAFDKLGGAIAGYEFHDVLFIWAVASSAFGVANVLWNNASQISRLIITGELDAFLLQPCNTLLSVICARTSLAAYGDLLYGFVLIAIAFGISLTAWVWFLFGVIVGAVLLTAIALTAHTLTFYLGDASMLGGMATEFCINFTIYPEKIYGPAVRAIMYTLIPAGLIVHVPLSLMHSFSPLPALAVLLGAALYCTLASLFFYRGLRRYESGNLIVTRQ